MHQIRVVLCQILRRFDIFRDEDTPEPIYNPAMTLQAQNGVLLKMKRIWKNIWIIAKGDVQSVNK